MHLPFHLLVLYILECKMCTLDTTVMKGKKRAIHLLKITVNATVMGNGKPWQNLHFSRTTCLKSLQCDANNAPMKNCTDLNLGEVVYISIIYLITGSWLHLLNGYDYFFLMAWQSKPAIDHLHVTSRRRCLIYICLQLVSSMVPFVWKSVIFWISESCLSKKKIFISWFLSIWEVKVVEKVFM